MDKFPIAENGEFELCEDFWITLFAGISAICAVAAVITAFRTVRLTVIENREDRFLEEHRIELSNFDQLITLFEAVCANWLTRGGVSAATLREIERELLILETSYLVGEDIRKWKDVFIDRLVFQNEFAEQMLPKNFETLVLNPLGREETIEVYLAKM